MAEEGKKKEIEAQVVPAESMSAAFRGEADVQIVTAHRFPRSLERARQRILTLATQSKEIAEQCWYTLPREGKTIEGPSIRFAEIVASAYGNLRVKAEIGQIGDKFVEAHALCWDLENNVAFGVTVKRRIVNKYGKRFSDDMIAVTANAAAAIAMRNAVFKVVPAALMKETISEVQRVGMGDERTLVEKRKAMLAHFASLKVPEKQVLALLGKAGVEDIGLPEMKHLRGIATAIKDGEISAEEAFRVRGGEPERASVPLAAITPGRAADYQEHDKPPPPPEADELAAERSRVLALVDELEIPEDEFRATMKKTCGMEEMLSLSLGQLRQLGAAIKRERTVAESDFGLEGAPESPPKKGKGKKR